MSRNSYQQHQQRILKIIPTNNRYNKRVSDGCADVTLDATLSYLNQMLFEEDINENGTLHTNEFALYAMEKPLYDIVGEKYPPSVRNPQLLNQTESGPSSTDCSFLNEHSSTFGVPSGSEFNKGSEEGTRFLPRIDNLVSVLGTEAKKPSFALVPEEDDLIELNSDIYGDEKNHDVMGFGSTGKNKSNFDLDILEGRTRKIPTTYFEESPRNEMLEKVLLENFDELLLDKHKNVGSLQKYIQSNTSKYSDDQAGTTDLKALLIECSHAVHANDHQLAERLINRIRKLSSPDGDGAQRMASAFADALEARMNGIKSQAWQRIPGFSASEFLRIAQLYITVCPFPSVSSYYANQTILKVMGKASKLHIIDFGIGLGFQWPSLIQALSKNGKSIKLKITGIDFPQSGFRPAEQIQETGRRLESYAESFGVPFEYHGIASKWEEISPGDLKIKEDEVLIANCIFRLKEVGDESVSLDSPRDQVLKLIRTIQPRVFIHGIVNFNSFSPFFISRFKQALTLYSSLFEIIDTVVPRDNKQRQSVEKGFIARNILNVIACEGSDWIMKPETYKQWHTRNLRAGLEQIPLDPSLLKECEEKMKNGNNNKNNIFVIDNDKNWLLLGWRGRINNGISTWKAKMA